MGIAMLHVSGHTEYFGRKLNFHDHNRADILNGISLGWDKLYKLKPELTGRWYSLRWRMRFFNGVISPTILSGSEALVLNKGNIPRTQRQMLRMIIQV